MLFSTNVFVKHLNISEKPYNSMTDGRWKKEEKENK